jgi:hypothetical protein
MLTSLVLTAAIAKPLILAHYMPWYQAPPKSSTYGWHWTMNHFEPTKGQIASHFTPTIGPYDSGDPEVIEYQILTMKIAGIDGVIFDWYGTMDTYDYKQIHQNTTLFISIAEKLNFKYAICYEDQSIKNSIEQKQAKANLAQSEFKTTVDTLKSTWFKSPNYVKLNNEPILLIFGPQFLKKDQIHPELKGIQSFGVLANHDYLTGGFGWPEPQVGSEKSFLQLQDFYKRAQSWNQKIAVAYPRFQDIYHQAKLHDSYGTIQDQNGKTFDITLQKALESKSPIIQIATWNDWGEGTQIEPSREFQSRDLEKLQSFRIQNINPHFTAKPIDLQLPYRLLQLRQKGRDPKKLEEIKTLINSSRFKTADSRLNDLEKD